MFITLAVILSTLSATLCIFLLIHRIRRRASASRRTVISRNSQILPEIDDDDEDDDIVTNSSSSVIVVASAGRCSTSGRAGRQPSDCERLLTASEDSSSPSKSHCRSRRSRVDGGRRRQPRDAAGDLEDDDDDDGDNVNEARDCDMPMMTSRKRKGTSTTERNDDELSGINTEC